MAENATRKEVRREGRRTILLLYLSLAIMAGRTNTLVIRTFLDYVQILNVLDKEQ
jgi:hypothetical protein